MHLNVIAAGMRNAIDVARINFETDKAGRNFVRLGLMTFRYAKAKDRFRRSLPSIRPCPYSLLMFNERTSSISPLPGRNPASMVSDFEVANW